LRLVGERNLEETILRIEHARVETKRTSRGRASVQSTKRTSDGQKQTALT
jgi:hypothetical protein